MPYEIKKINNGFKVCKKDDLNKCFSKKLLTKKNALAQMRAIIMSERNLLNDDYAKFRNKM